MFALSIKSVLVLLALLRESIAVPSKVVLKSAALLNLRKESSLEPGFKFNIPIPLVGSVPIDTSPLDLMPSLSLEAVPSDVLRTNLEVPSVAPVGTVEEPVSELVPVRIH